MSSPNLTIYVWVHYWALIETMEYTHTIFILSSVKAESEKPIRSWTFVRERRREKKRLILMVSYFKWLPFPFFSLSLLSCCCFLIVRIRESFRPFFFALKPESFSFPFLNWLFYVLMIFKCNLSFIRSLVYKRVNL